jgi:uncharacterized membrane protein YsdA (DUF1294 family)
MQSSGAKPYIFYLCFSIGVGAVTTYLMWSEAQLALSVSALLGVNAASLVCMGLDKSLARPATMRIPEVLLYVLALFGGVPGIILGGNVFKHKTRKASFQFVLIMILVVQLLVMRFLEGIKT